MKLYKVSNEYIKKLSVIDDRVPFNKSNKSQRPYVGIIKKIGDYNYFVPLSSYKKHKHKSSPITILIRDSNNHFIAAAQINNMIPVPPGSFEKINIKEIAKVDQKYSRLLSEEIKYINLNKNFQIKLMNKINNIHINKTNNSIDSRWNKLTLNFSQLEEYYDKTVNRKFKKEATKTIKPKQNTLENIKE